MENRGRAYGSIDGGSLPRDRSARFGSDPIDITLMKICRWNFMKAAISRVSRRRGAVFVTISFNLRIRLCCQVPIQQGAALVQCASGGRRGGVHRHHQLCGECCCHPNAWLDIPLPLATSEDVCERSLISCCLPQGGVQQQQRTELVGSWTKPTGIGIDKVRVCATKDVPLNVAVVNV